MKFKLIITLLSCTLLCSLVIGCNNAANNSSSQSDTDIHSSSSQNLSSDSEESSKENESVKSNDESADRKNIQEDVKQYYLNQYLAELEQIENNDIQSNRTAYSTVDIASYASEFLGKYDKLLNDIYKSLKEVLSSDEFKKLEAEEMQWINDKEAALNKVAEDAKGGGSMYAYMGSLTAMSYTHDRIYELLEYLGNNALKDKDEAYNYLLEQDKIYIDKQLANNDTLKYSRTVPLSDIQDSFVITGTINENFYVFTLENAAGDEPLEYYIGETSKKIYLAPNQGGAALLQIKNGAVVNHFDWLMSDNCTVWR